MLKNYLEQIADIVGYSVRVYKFEVDSFMRKYQEEGRFLIFMQDVQDVFLPSNNWPHTDALDQRPEYIGEFALVSLPGCCGAVVSTHSFVNERYRNRGLGTLLNEMRRELAYRLGYGLMLCTDLASNVPQQKVLERNGWTLASKFQNRRTLNTLNLHYVHLLPTGIELGFDPHTLWMNDDRQV